MTNIIDKNTASRILKTLVTIRKFEECALKLFTEGELPGWLHVYIGEEAVATGVCLNLRKEDYITSTHRGHGHCIAKGVNLKNMMAELFGKKTGTCKGKGGSQHIADLKCGILGANGIVGGGIPIATGAALGCKYLDNDSISICFFGDGASDSGGFHESLNMAAIWNLPVIYLIENNFYCNQTCRLNYQKKITDIADRAKSYGIPGIIVDGMDVVDVFTKIDEIVKAVRNGEGPYLVEAKTYRYGGHWVGDPELYRTKEEVDKWKEKDPILGFEKYILKNKLMDSLEVELIKNKVADEINEAISFAKESPFPAKEEAVQDLYL